MPPLFRDPPPPYRAPSWLPGAHAQTIYPLLIAPPSPARRRERWDTPDGDFIDLDWCDAAGDAVLPQQSADSQTLQTCFGTPAASALPPLLVLFHGLEGSADSPYATALLGALKSIGWGGVVPHFRGCSGEPNRLPRAYHSGDADEIDWILARVGERFPGRRLFAVGVSLGGNALLKWAGERGDVAAQRIAALVAVSAPLDLAACGHHLGRGFNRVYTRHFLNTMKANAAEKLRRFPGLVDARRLAAATTLYEFDDLFTAPLHGFTGVEDYWRRASAKPWLPAIRLPALLINAQNDPFMPPGVLPVPAAVASSLRLDFPREGGHVGFVSGGLPGRLDWLPRRILHFFSAGTGQ
ncbi:hydrolase [Rhodocyclus tenuis]|nr:hydrolase [Rhodocyclus tenuis]